MRIGVRVAPDATSGAAFSAAGAEEAAVAVGGGNEASLREVLAKLAPKARARATGDVAVAFDLDGALSERVIIPGAVERGSVLLVLIAPRPPSHPALLRHPDPLVARHIAASTPIRGGHSVSGAELAELDVVNVLDVARRLGAGEYGDVREVAIVASGSLASPEHERRAAEAFLTAVDGVRVSTSCDFGGVGFIDRMCSTVLNAVLTRHADPLVTACERVSREVLGDVAIGFARGDGGRVPAPRMRAFPVVGVRASVACTLAGASAEVGNPDCRVVVADGGRLRVGDVVGGLPVTSPERPLTGRTRLSLPTPKLGDVCDGTFGRQPGPGSEPILAIGSDMLDELLHHSAPTDLRRVDPGNAALRGAAWCEPMAYIDEIVPVTDARGVRQAQTDLERRALVMAVSAGGQPGTERIVESSVMGVPYGGAASVRVRVRSTCALTGGER